MPAIRIPLMRSTFFDEATTKKKLADFILSAARLSMGDECKKFETAFAVYQERKHAVLVSNGSTANLGLIQALLNLGRLKKGDKVGISALTWATNVMPLMQLGLVPVAVDCDLVHLNVTSKEFAKHVKNLKAMFITNVLGMCGDIDAIKALCDKHQVILIEDNCESLGTRYKGKLLGNYGVASTFSFFVGHHLSTIEGGMICTDDEELANMLIMVRAHGWDRNLPPAAQQKLRTGSGVDDFYAKYLFHYPAYNIRATEITGFLGTTQLPLLDGTIAKRRKNFEAFHAAVQKKSDLYHSLSVDHIEHLSSFAMPVIATSHEILRKTLERFENAGVETRPVIAGDITEHPFWKNALPKADCPTARIVHSQGFYFPNNPDLTEEEVRLLCELVTG